MNIADISDSSPDKSYLTVSEATFTFDTAAHAVGTPRFTLSHLSLREIASSSFAGKSYQLGISADIRDTARPNEL